MFNYRAFCDLVTMYVFSIILIKKEDFSRLEVFPERFFLITGSS